MLRSPNMSARYSILVQVRPPRFGGDGAQVASAVWEADSVCLTPERRDAVVRQLEAPGKVVSAREWVCRDV